MLNQHRDAEGIIGSIVYDRGKWIGYMPLGGDNKQTTVISHGDETLVRMVMIQVSRICRQREDYLWKRALAGKNGWYDSYGDNSIGAR